MGLRCLLFLIPKDLKALLPSWPITSTSLSARCNDERVAAGTCALPQPADLDAHPREMIFQCVDAGGEPTGKPACCPDTVKEGPAQRLGALPGFGGDIGMQRRLGNRVG